MSGSSSFDCIQLLFGNKEAKLFEGISKYFTSTTTLSWPLLNMMRIYGSAGSKRWKFWTFCGNFYYFYCPGYDAAPPILRSSLAQTNLAVKVWVLWLSIANHSRPVGKTGFSFSGLVGLVVEHHFAPEAINNAKIYYSEQSMRFVRSQSVI